MARPVDSAQFWDGLARKYAAHRIKDMPGYERTIDAACQLLRSTDMVLEIGCGTGTTALRLAPSVARIVATDVSGAMIDIARQKAVDAGCQNAEFRVAAADDLHDGESAYDAVLAFNVLHLIADRAAALKAIHRQLRPGGLLITKTPCLAEMNPLVRLAVPVMQAFGKAPFVAILKAQDLEAEIAAAGFTITERARHGSGRKDPRIFLVART